VAFAEINKHKTRRPFLVGGFVVIDQWMKFCFSQAWRRPTLPRLEARKTIGAGAM
jgi:hypothetical protein